MSGIVLAFRGAPPAPADPYAIGARVTYCDAANPLRVYVIVEPAKRAGWLRVVTEDGAHESMLHHRDLGRVDGWGIGPPGIVNPRAVAYLIRAADAARERQLREQHERLERRQRAAATGAAFLEERRPPWAKALIIAELHEDQSDSQTDYFAHRTVATLVLAWSKHTRDLFPELRRAALVAPETAELAAAPASAEHREKWSMGGGFYLKADWRHAGGWAVRKVRFSESCAAYEAVGVDPSAYRVGSVPQ